MSQSNDLRSFCLVISSIMSTDIHRILFKEVTQILLPTDASGHLSVVNFFGQAVLLSARFQPMQALLVVELLLLVIELLVFLVRLIFTLLHADSLVITLSLPALIHAELRVAPANILAEPIDNNADLFLKRYLRYSWLVSSTG